MKPRLLAPSLTLALGLLSLHGPAQAQDGGQLNVICSVQAEWCNMIQTVFARTTGIKVNMSLKGSGEALAQLIAERANPKTDVWFGGTGDPHLQAAEQGLALEYKSARCRSCTPGRSSRRSKAATRRWASTAARWALATTPSCWPRRSCPGAADLGRPAQPRLQGRDPGRQPGQQRHGLHHDRHAGAADGRGQGLRLHEGSCTRTSPPTHAAAPARSRPWPAARPRCRSASCTTARARRCRASRWPPSRRPKAPAPRSAR
jgi:hypothetical protein